FAEGLKPGEAAVIRTVNSSYTLSRQLASRPMMAPGRDTEGAMGDERELEDLARKWKGTRAWARARAVLLTRQGRAAAEVAGARGCRLARARPWLALDRAGGAAPRGDRPPAGGPPRLNPGDGGRLRPRLDAGPTPADGVGALRGEDV